MIYIQAFSFMICFFFYDDYILFVNSCHYTLHKLTVFDKTTDTHIKNISFSSFLDTNTRSSMGRITKTSNDTINIF